MKGVEDGRREEREMLNEEAGKEGEREEKKCGRREGVKKREVVF